MHLPKGRNIEYIMQRQEESAAAPQSPPSPDLTGFLPLVKNVSESLALKGQD